jgi:hypothetical protein
MYAPRGDRASPLMDGNGRQGRMLVRRRSLGQGARYARLRGGAAPVIGIAVTSGRQGVGCQETVARGLVVGTAKPAAPQP